MEETDSDSGYIKIDIRNITGPVAALSSYKLYVDETKVDCNEFFKYKIYKFLGKKWKEMEKIKKEEEVFKFKNKYNI